ncbi:hypothetical protein [Bradyrhizobium sp. ORS 111]|uniref:hypothetical protein n=1 Tax=Bradyrhizobium sp. ORS 111 TaxID=1685958 RepID=UPI003890FE8E
MPGPRPRLPTRKIRDVLRLSTAGMSKIAASLSALEVVALRNATPKLTACHLAHVKLVAGCGHCGELSPKVGMRPLRSGFAVNVALPTTPLR